MTVGARSSAARSASLAAYLPRLARPHRHAPHGRAVRLSGDAARHRRHRRARAAHRRARRSPSPSSTRRSSRGSCAARRWWSARASTSLRRARHRRLRRAHPRCATSCRTSPRVILVQTSLLALGRDPGRGVAVVPRPRHAAADALARPDARRRAATSSCSRPGARSSPASRSCSCPSASTSWATPCATRSTRACGGSRDRDLRRSRLDASFPGRAGRAMRAVPLAFDHGGAQRVARRRFRR